MTKSKPINAKGLKLFLKREKDLIPVIYQKWQTSQDNHKDIMASLTVESNVHQTTQLRVYSYHKPISIYF
jgi:hypothetical protein